MATSAKPQKDKPHGAPRLTPRPTAASAARAARNATNRNLALQPPPYRHSPTRATASPPLCKAKNPLRSLIKADSRTDVKVTAVKCDSKSFVIDVPTLPADEIQETSIDVVESICPNEQEIQEPVKSEQYEIISTSQPQTPAKSRPVTPKDGVKSSRPTTPAHPLRHAPPPPGSRPTTPHQSLKPTTPTSVSSPPARATIPPASPTTYASSLKEDDDIKSAFNAKQKQFQVMKKELDMKQQAILEVFDCLQDLNKRMISESTEAGCGEGLQIQELEVFNVGDWSAEEVAQLCRDAVASCATEGAVELINTNKSNIDEHILAELDAKVTKVPSCFADLCLQAFTARQELIDWVKELIGKHDDGCGESLDRIARYNSQGLELCETLRDLKSCADDAVDTVTQLFRQAWRERSALVTVGESLVREIANLRQDLGARALIVDEMREVPAENESCKALEDMRRELEEERAARAPAKDKLATAESQLRQARGRVNKMDRQLREAEATIASLTGTVKSLEDQSRQREVQLEARVRKLKEYLKTGEVASNQIAQQRDALQTEVQSLKEQIETLTGQHKSSIQELNKEIKDLKAVLDEQRQLSQKELEVRKSTEAKLAEYHNNIEELKTKNAELESSKHNPELPTEREMDLWAELQATKDALRMTEDEVSTCKREKVRFLETLTKIAETENKVGMQQKLAAELLSKEEVVSKMQTQIRELMKNIKFNEQKVIQYEQYVRDLQAHSRAVANCQEAPNGISYQDLQQEIMNLRMGLLDAVHRNEELSEIVAQKEQQLEQQDKTSRAQARVIKVREELINMLKNKETEQSRELAALQQDLEHRMKIVDKVNKQIAAKADDIQELFATLENKQLQIHRLEKIVLALEEQQRRGQAQRTRHEEKIAALEHELAAGNRERKFIFF